MQLQAKKDQPAQIAQPQLPGFRPAGGSQAALPDQREVGRPLDARFPGRDHDCPGKLTRRTLPNVADSDCHCAWNVTLCVPGANSEPEHDYDDQVASRR